MFVCVGVFDLESSTMRRPRLELSCCSTKKMYLVAVKQLLNDEMARLRKVGFVACFKVLTLINMEELRKTTKILILYVQIYSSQGVIKERHRLAFEYF